MSWLPSITATFSPPRAPPDAPPEATDLLIIATAAATGRILHTLDTRQAALAQAAGIHVQSNA
jgi:hypothetical protein